MRLVTVVNRTKEVLEGTYDGRQTRIEPGENKFSIEEALRYRDQHPVMGTEDIDTGHCEYKIAIPELGDDIEPLPEDLEEPTERLNRDLIYQPPGTTTEVIESRGGLYSRPERLSFNLPQEDIYFEK